MKLWSLCRTLLVPLLLIAGCGQGDEQRHDGMQPSAETQSQLENLGYVNVVPVEPEQEETAGVTRYDRSSSHGGLNLFNSRNESVAKLMTMDGRVVHQWASDLKGRGYDWFREHLPSHMPNYLEGWNHVELLDNGDLLVIGTHHMLLRLAWDSSVKWKLDIAAHHDVSVSESGDIYVLTDGVRTTEIDGELVTFQDNSVVILTGDGVIKRTISLFDAFGVEGQEGELRKRLLAIKGRQAKRLEFFRKRAELGDEQEKELLRLYEAAIAGDLAEDESAKNLLLHGRAEDIFHSNSIQVLEHEKPGLWPKRGLLISISKLATIAVIDEESGLVVWSWGREHLQAAHHATQLADGTVLIFDNGIRRKYSRILKVDPRTRRIVWEYKADPPAAFYSAARGGAEELPNGNILIAETDNGRAFEVTPDGEIVWEYYDDVLPGKAERSAIYRMTRIDSPAVEPLLQFPE